MINIVLFEPEIPGNTGNIIRTAVATNSKLHLIKPLGFKLDQSSVKRSGVNYVEDCTYEIYESIQDFFKKNNGSYFFFTRYGHKPQTDFNFANRAENIYLIFGKESTGLPLGVLKQYLNNCIRIPTTDKVRALNLSNAVAIAVYEVLRQQEYPNLLFDEPHKSKRFIEDN